MEFASWFEVNSGYALHRVRPEPLRGCCAENAVEDGRRVWLPGRDAPCPLFRCAACGRLYARLENGCHAIDHPLRYRIDRKPDKNF